MCEAPFQTNTHLSLKKRIKRETQYRIKASNHLGPVWYTCLKTENCCLKIFVEIRVGEKKSVEMREMLFKN